MAISVFDLFKIGIGPSSSHTVGPMRAAGMFAESLASDGVLGQVARVRAELFGSLGATGHGHGSVPAIVLGLLGEHPETVDPAATTAEVEEVRRSGLLTLGGPSGVGGAGEGGRSGVGSAGLGDAVPGQSRVIDFDVDADIVLHRRKRLPFHSNAMVFTATSADGTEPSRRTYYSVGGGFVSARAPRAVRSSFLTPCPCRTHSPAVPSCSPGRGRAACRSAE
jgi:L-serine dehydratase